MHLTLRMEYGGLERLVDIFAKKMDRNEFEVSICSLDGGGSFLDDLRKCGIPDYVFNRRPGIIDLSLLARLISLIKGKHIDVLHSHSGCSFYGAIAGRFGGVKGIIHTDHGRLIPDRRGLRLEDKIASMIINKYIAVSDDLYDYLLRVVKIQKKKLATIINGVDTELFRPFPKEQIREIKREFGLVEDSKVIGTVCRLDPVKNLFFMIEALKDVLNSHPEAKILIVGEGQERGRIEDAKSKYGIADKVILLGERNDVERIIPIFDLFVLPSLSEGTSMTILEAMACGIPVVASEVGGNGRLVRENINGYLFKL